VKNRSTSTNSCSVQPWQAVIRRWIAGSGYRPVAASVTTHTSVRVLRSRPGRVQSAPNTVSVATSMNVFMMGSPYTPRFTRSTYSSPRSCRPTWAEAKILRIADAYEVATPMIRNRRLTAIA
jgi:hypothetical protein